MEARLFGDPIVQLRKAVLASDSGFTNQHTDRLSVRDLLQKTAEARTKSAHGRILLVIDQFEEFLILRKEQEHRAFVAFLNELLSAPIQDLLLLLVFRGD